MKNIRWNRTDWEARKSFIKTYKKGTWDKGIIGKIIFIYSMVTYVAMIAAGAYFLTMKMYEIGFELPEKIEKLKNKILGKTSTTSDDE